MVSRIKLQTSAQASAPRRYVGSVAIVLLIIAGIMLQASAQAFDDPPINGFG
ncbi:MAG: hypothetical protein HQ518_22575 [Rhodopirellula sp.]|nr:hypothetical protein [Rhodopirellula sp.]